MPNNVFVKIINANSYPTGDADFQRIITHCVVPGVESGYLEELLIEDGKVNAGAAYILTTRTSTGENFLTVVDVPKAFDFDTQNTGYVGIILDQQIINDPLQVSKLADNVASIQFVSTVPETNFLLLAKVEDGTITDQRTFAKIDASVIPSSYTYAEDTGNVNEYEIRLDGVRQYIDGMHVTFKANTANTGDATIQINQLGKIPIKKNFNIPLIGGDIQAGQIVELTYNSSINSFSMTSQTGNPSTVPAFASIDEALAGTETGKMMSPATTNAVISNNAKSVTLGGIAGEEIETGDAVRFGIGGNRVEVSNPLGEVNTTLAVGSTSTNQINKIGITFEAKKNHNITSVSLVFGGYTQYGLWLRIYEADENGFPTTTPLVQQIYGFQTTTVEKRTITLINPLELEAGKKYCVCFEPQSSSYPFTVAFSSDIQNPQGESIAYTYSPANWAIYPNGVWAYEIMGDSVESGEKIYLSNADDIETAVIEGFATATVSKDDSMLYDTKRSTKMSDLTASKYYFLSNTKGKISEEGGTYVTLAGIAQSATVIDRSAVSSDTFFMRAGEAGKKGQIVRNGLGKEDSFLSITSPAEEKANSASPTTSSWIFQSFTMPNGQNEISTIEIPIWNYNNDASATLSFVAQLCEFDGTKPTTVINEQTIQTQTTLGNVSWGIMGISLKDISDGKKFAIVVKGTTSNTRNLRVPYATTSAYDGGIYGGTSNSGTDWSTYPTYTMGFKVNSNQNKMYAYLTDANNQYKTKWIGALKKDVARNEIAEITFPLAEINLPEVGYFSLDPTNKGEVISGLLNYPVGFAPTTKNLEIGNIPTQDNFSVIASNTVRLSLPTEVSISGAGGGSTNMKRATVMKAGYLRCIFEGRGGSNNQSMQVKANGTVISPTITMPANSTYTTYTITTNSAFKFGDEISLGAGAYQNGGYIKNVRYCFDDVSGSGDFIPTTDV